MSSANLVSPKAFSLTMALLCVNAHVRQLLQEYSVEHVKSNTYYLQGNGQVLATNKSLFRNLRRIVWEEPKWCADFLSLVLWVYRMLKHTSTKTTTFSLVYGSREWFSSRCGLVFTSKLLDSHDCINHIEALKERRCNAENQWLSFQKTDQQGI